MSARRASAPTATLGALAVDAILVVAFAAIGRASHDGDVLAGLWLTAWPFLTGLVAGWVLSLAWRGPFSPVRTGIPVWITTVLIGMLVRAATGQGTAFAFIVMASVTLGVLLVGWRLMAPAVQRRPPRG